MILVRRETTPEDIRGMQAADGILTAFGGASRTRPSSAGRWARSASSAARHLQIDYDEAHRHGRRQGLKEGDFISVDGFTGEVIAGQVATKPSEVVQVLIRQDAEAGAVERLSAVRQADGVGRRASAS